METFLLLIVLYVYERHEKSQLKKELISVNLKLAEEMERTKDQAAMLAPVFFRQYQDPEILSAEDYTEDEIEALMLRAAETGELEIAAELRDILKKKRNKNK